MSTAIFSSAVPPANAQEGFLAGKSVCLDPGHGGSDTGAVYNDGTISDLDGSMALYFHNDNRELAQAIYDGILDYFITGASDSPLLSASKALPTAHSLTQVCQFPSLARFRTPKMAT